MPNFLTILNLVATFGLIVGGLLAYHHGFARTATEVQERVIRLLQSEIGALQDRIDALEKENTRLSQVIMTIRAYAKQRYGPMAAKPTLIWGLANAPGA